MKKYKRTIISLIVFAVLNAALSIFCYIRCIPVMVHGGDLLHALSTFERGALFGLLLASLSTVLCFSKKENLKPVYIIALVELILVCLGGIMLLVALAMGAL